MLMNGKEVNHLVINGETFDKRYWGKDVEILNKIYGESTVNINGAYHKALSVDSWLIYPGTKGYAVALKFYDCYYIAQKNGDGGAAWVQSSDIKILD